MIAKVFSKKVTRRFFFPPLPLWRALIDDHRYGYGIDKENDRNEGTLSGEIVLYSIIHFPIFLILEYNNRN